MSKARTVDEFSSQLAADLTWRVKEISDLKSAVRNGDRKLQKVLLRALVTLSYAHWEGHVRFAARKYFEHVALRKFPYSSLDRQFVRNCFLSQLAALSNSKTSLEARCALVDEILESSNKQFKTVDKRLIDTQSNLSFGVVSDICLICGVQTHYFDENRLSLTKFCSSAEMKSRMVKKL